MSYILDALRKADAQRARDPARGIHAQAAAATSGEARVGRRRDRWIWGTVAGVIFAAAAWVWISARDAAAPPVATVPAPPRVDAGVAMTVAPPAAAVLPAPPAVVVAPPPVIAATPEVRRPPARDPQTRSQPAPVPAVPAPVATVAPAAAPAPVADRTYSLAELPGDVQQALPKFTVSGGVYSENVAQRMLIVNGQVFNEGSEIAPGVVLEQIRARVAVLRFRGLRIAQPF